MCASDMVYSSTALMEDTEKPYHQAFFIALEALSRQVGVDVFTNNLKKIYYYFI